VSAPLSKPRGFSLGTKLTLLTVLIELLFLSGVLISANRFLAEKNLQQNESMLLSQVDLIASEVANQKNHAPPFQFSGLNLAPEFSFQLISTNGTIFWDSKNPKRVQTQIIDQHALYTIASKSSSTRANTTFEVTSTAESFLGAYHKVGNQYLVLGAVSSREISVSTYHALEKILFMILFFCGVSFLLTVTFTHRMVKPIRKLTTAAKNIAAGNFDFELDTPSNDEIGTLSESFSSMVDRVRELLKEEVQKVRIEQEVNIAAEIQQSLLPKEDIQTRRYEIQSYYQSATETGGDYWGYFETDRNLVIYIADATGHGLSSAMLTASARGCFSAMHRLLVEYPELPALPSSLLSYANEAILDSAQDELNMTMFIASYSFADGMLRYASAGHNPAWIIRSEGPKKLELLQCLGPRLGETKKFEAPLDKITPLGPNDVLVLYTDGLLDCTNPDQVSYGKNRAKELIINAGGANLNIRNMRDQLVADFSNFTENKPLQDDISFAFLKLKGGGKHG
jgi:sigma-B regulation protein RsbU (phosphoserine phosphatase)